MSIYFCGKNDIICYVIRRKVIAVFFKQKTKKILWCQIEFFDHLQPFLVETFFDQVPNKGSALVKCHGHLGARRFEWQGQILV